MEGNICFFHLLNSATRDQLQETLDSFWNWTVGLGEGTAWSTLIQWPECLLCASTKPPAEETGGPVGAEGLQLSLRALLLQ